MLKLKEIELLGFKSFADRTRLACDGGTAAIVGPNGCGKSNLADAVGWVLGEQSARTLRGERMSDVIFSGTTTRPATGLAEVSVKLVDEAESERDERSGAQGAENGGPPQASETSAGAPPEASPKSSANGEIKVTRRLFRSGESEYLLNGAPCRLRDIQDLFMGTGLGPESYAIIEQGRIGQILSSKPSDRRCIIEEAAGISKFKSRKRLAEAKLESSRQNLARLNDILEEISRQVNSLKRQASKAARHRELLQELRTRQKHVCVSRWRQMEAGVQALRADSQGILREFTSATRELETLEAERNAAARRHEQLEDEMKRLRDSVAQNELQCERFQSRLEKSREQAQHLETRATEARREQEQLYEHTRLLEEKAREQAQVAEEVKLAWAKASTSAEELATRHAEKAAQLERLESEAEAQRNAVLEAVGRMADLRNQLAQAQESSLSIERQLARAASEQQAAKSEQARLAAELSAAQAEHSRQERARWMLARSLAELEAALSEAREQETALREQAEKLAEALATASARQQALGESLARHAYAADSVQRLLSVSSAENGFRPQGVIADFVEVASGYEDVVEEFLKAELDCVVVEKHEDARSGIALLDNDGGGRSAFFVRGFPSNGHGTQSQEATQARQEPGVVASLQELVHAEPRLGLNGDPVFPVLAQAFVVEDSSTAERLAHRYPSYHFLTRCGDHYYHRLVAGGKVASAGPLALRRDFREAERQSAELAGSSNDAHTRWADSRSRMEQLGQELHRLTTDHLGAEKQTVLTGEKLSQARQAAERALDRIRILDDEGAMLIAGREAAAGHERSCEAALEGASREQKRREQAMAEVAVAASQLRPEIEDLSRNLTDARVTAGALQERSKTAEGECARLDRERSEAREKVSRIEEQLQQWNDEGCRLKSDVEGAESLRREAVSKLDNLRHQLAACDEECQGAHTRRDALISQAEAARAQLDYRREERSQSEIALARAESDLSHLIQQSREELGAEPASLAPEMPADGVIAPEQLASAEEEVREVKARLERLGPVNMMALEELQEAEGRLSFLTTQRQDLLASINDTAQTIREIDEASRRKLMSAFNAINGFFGESFRTLFGGGAGEMRFSDPADPESGIDLVVQPPGKRLQNVLLLSGGEKALTALALLVAIFRFTPSPFCILDEVDAPLDDSNVIRFARMIQQMARETQFIIITHNRRTMDACNVLYGVTMEEPGISTLVSVRLEEAAARS